MKRYCLTLDLIDDVKLISEYEEHHKRVWPEVIDSIKGSGIISMEIYRFSNHLFMVMETEDTFSFESKRQLDAGNDKVQEWEELMWKYQQPWPQAQEGEKWMLMDKIFDLTREG